MVNMRRNRNVDELIHLNIRGSITHATEAAIAGSAQNAVNATLQTRIAQHIKAATENATYFAITRAVGRRPRPRKKNNGAMYEW